MKTSPKIFGSLAEKIATDYLKNKGYRILAKNYISKWASFDRKEIDIIAKKDDIITFFEVKSLSAQKGFLPEDKVDFKKQRKIIKTAERFLLEKKISLEEKWQIDVISIRIDPDSKKAKIRHLENAICD